MIPVAAHAAWVLLTFGLVVLGVGRPQRLRRRPPPPVMSCRVQLQAPSGRYGPDR